MIKWLYGARPAQLGSAALVVVCGAVVGRQAALGMSPGQWIIGVTTILAAICAAVLIHTAPAKAEGKG